MILVQRYIFKELLYNFIFTFVVVALIMLLAMAVKVVFQFPVLGFLWVVKLIPIMLMASLTIIVPAGVLIATVMTYGRIAADNEIITMRASGIHIVRIIIPGILFGLITSLALLVINDHLAPKAEVRLKGIESNLNVSLFFDTALDQGRKELDLNDWLLTWEDCTKVVETGGDGNKKKSVESWRFTGLRGKLYDKEGVLKQEIVAELGIIKAEDGGRKLVPILINGDIVFGGEGSFEQLILPPFEFGARHKSTKIRLSMRDFGSLTAINGREEKAYPEHMVSTELHKRIADSFCPLVFIFLSLPVAILFKQQNRMVAFLISIIIALFVYYPISLLGETFAKEGFLHPVLSIWPGNVALAGLGFLFIWKVMRR